MNLYKKNILKYVMPMSPRRHHKYLYIDANGNYVYPKDVAKKAGNKARDLNAQGQANAVNMRKARAESVKAGNSRMAAKLKGIYDQGQANNINAHKARAESINAGNERIANSKAYKVGKTILGETKAGKKLKRLGKYANNVRDEFAGVELPKGNKVKPRQKTPEEIAREDAELEKRVSEGMTEFAAKYAEDYYKEQAKKKAEKLPEGWVRDQNGYVYDDIRAMAIDPNDPVYKKKKKRAKKSAKKLIKTSVTHSDTYRSNVMNSHQRMIYSSQLQHAERRNHKYLYKIGDRYVYPEDISRGIKKKAQKIINGPKTYKKDREFMKEPGNSINGVNKEEDQIGSAHTGSFIKKKTPDSGYQWADRREYEEAAERRVRSGKDYSNQIERENANKEASRKTNQKRKLRDIRARKISKSIESRNRENEQARYFDEEAYKKRRRKALQHGVEWKRHKYLYKDANGNYVYPEDIKNNAKSKVQGFVADQKQKLKDKKFVKEGPYKNSPYTSDYDRARQQTDQISYAHRESTGKKDKGTMSNTRNVALDYVRQTDKYPSEKAKSLVKQKEKTKQRKEEAANKEFLAEHKKINQQRKSAHAGYEADKKAFPEGGSTEELERQKAKTHARKRLKGDEVNRFRRDPAIDNDPEVKAARKKWLGKEENDGRNTVTADSAAGRSINAHKMYDSVNRTSHEGAKRKASWEKYSAGQKSGDARREYLATRQRAAEKDYLTQTRKARETKARTEDTVERMRKKKKRSSR